MKRFLSAALCILMIVLFLPQSMALVGDENLSRSKVSAKKILRGVSINFGMSTYAMDDLPTEMTLSNNTSRDYAYGAEFSVEKKIGKNWYALPKDSSIMVPAIGFVLSAHAMETSYWNVKSGFGDSGRLYTIQPGTYRMVLEMQDEKTGAKGYAVGEFKLHPPNGLTLYATEPVYVRSGPGTRYPIINELPRGGTVEYLTGESGKWVRCLYDPTELGGQIAYVYGEYLSMKKPSRIGTEFYATVPLNFRAAPSEKSEVLGTLQVGNTVEVMGKSGAWLKVAFRNRTAFVYGKYLAPCEKSGLPPVPGS